jgi:hypothetical protein
MLGKPSRRTEKRLQEHGVSAPAVVLEIAEKGMAITNGAEGIVANTTVMLKTKLRVEPDGRPAFEVEHRFRFPQLAIPSAGSRIAVIFDPEDTDKLMLDESASGQIHSMLQGAGIAPEKAAFVESISAAAMGGASPADLTAMASQMSGMATVFSGMGMPQAPPADPEQARLNQLEQLASLHERGVLTDTEFAAQKAQILGS